jgi:pyridoxal phosphate enzyme (YggS family)
MINTDKLDHIKKEIGEDCKLIAVSKRQADEKIEEILAYGHNVLGENYVQALVERYEKFKSYDIEWHMIGHLQSNKVKYIAPFIHLIHAVDSFNLLKTINKEALKNNRIIDCLLQMHIAEEDSKFGMDETELKNLLDNPERKDLQNIRICGLMGMATFTEDEDQIRREYQFLKQLFKRIKKDYFPDHMEFRELSMGMSDDYPIALEEGSTMLRIGTLIFGPRAY